MPRREAVFPDASRMLKKTLLAGCLKMPRYKAPEISRSEA
jgi:hypothetical protein